MHNSLEISGEDFSDAYGYSNIVAALGSLTSEDAEDKPIIAVHTRGCNHISDLSENFISQEDKNILMQGVKKTAVPQHIKKRFLELSNSAMAEEFNAIFASMKETNRPVLYMRWIPKSDELYMSSRPSSFGHFICLYFVHDHNNNKSILISNPNGHEIKDECEVAAINSYLEENPVTIYHTRDYLQFDNTFCGPGSLVALRMFYNMDKNDFHNILKNGKQKQGAFPYTSIELGDKALQKEIDPILRKAGYEDAVLYRELSNLSKKSVPSIETQQKKIALILREADCNTAAGYIERLPKNEDKTWEPVPFLLKRLLDNQKPITGNYTSDQIAFLSRSLLTGRKMINVEQVEQINKQHTQECDRQDEPKRLFSNQPVTENYTNDRSVLLSKTLPNGREIINAEQAQPINKQTQKCEMRTEPQSYSTQCFLCGAIAGLSIAYLAKATALSPIIAMTVFFAAAIVGALIGYSIVKICERVSKEKQNSPEMDTLTTLSKVLTPKCLSSDDIQIQACR